MSPVDRQDISLIGNAPPAGFDCKWKYSPPKIFHNTEQSTILEDLTKDEKWDEFLDHMVSDVDNPNETMQLQSFIRNREYRDICEKIARGEYVFSTPTRIEIPKPGKKETRKVYTFKNGKDTSEHTVVRMIAWLLNRYNYLFQPNLFSVTENDGVRGAVNHLRELVGNGNKHSYKADLSNFFNSIDVDMLLEDLKHYLDERDAGTVNLFQAILKNPKVKAVGGERKKPEIIDDYEKGVMAGMPFQSFLSNFFLKDLDWILYFNKINYYRYADDMMLVSESPEKLEQAIKFVIDYVNKKRLSLNPKKVERYYPGDEFIFLGICFVNGTTTISDSTVKKQKAKIRVMARKFRRRHERGLITRDTAVAIMVKWLSSYHYGSDVMPYCFSKMYFPLITSSQKLNEIDKYAQECIRYVYSGKMRLGSSKEVTYTTLKMLGYLPLVSAFRIYKEENYHR